MFDVQSILGPKQGRHNYFEGNIALRYVRIVSRPRSPIKRGKREKQHACYGNSDRQALDDKEIGDIWRSP